MGGEFLKPDLQVEVQAALVVVDKDRGSNVHGVYQDHAFLDATLSKAVLNLPRDIHEPSARRDVEPEVFTIAFHKTPNYHGAMEKNERFKNENISAFGFSFY